MPLVILFLLGNSTSLTVRDLPIIVQDLDDTPASRSLIDAFRASITFHVVSWPTDKQPELALSTNVARGALIIPFHFSSEMARGNATVVQMLVDGSDANTAKLIQGYTAQIVRAFVQSNAGATRPAPVRAEIRLWYNPGRDSKKFYGPGYFVLGLSMFPPLLAALAMSKEGEQKTILQVYASSIPAHQFLLGKILAFMTIALAEWVLCMIALFTYFGLSPAGDITPLLVGTIFYTFCVAAFGTLIGAAIPSQAAAIQTVSLGGFLLAFLLSGLIFPVENIPAGLRWISNIVWARYYIQIVRDALLQGGGWPAMWFPVLMIGVIGTVFYLLAWRSMRRMQLKA
jgi:ABC-2 type transport system permease protein